MTDLASAAAQLSSAFSAADPSARLRALRSAVPGRIVFTTSLGLEDQVITHLIAAAKVDIEIVTLDTGRMFPESYTLWRDTEEKYGVTIRPFYPRGASLERLVAEQGIDGFYNSIEARHACCEIRKVEPLKRALAGKKAWLTGMRREQSTTRTELDIQRFDSVYGLEKFNPLADWSEDEVWTYLRARDVPYNALYDQGYRSIGCAPCSRPVVAGEDVRAGRWWWEQPDSKECGLHVGPDGTLVRTQVGA